MDSIAVEESHSKRVVLVVVVIVSSWGVDGLRMRLR